ncbi:LOW QUALITY PROTEIN: hypothetical protein HID58_076294 [Brassica napus]|uniref:Uncharacterized protein n=1 Tax=Brassica napus TaxID=3708 RepID=A0ABQ7YME0_BRANA|nr:LOW QUALITY PROTEIN: hypothetical protein HID58_076294 [Brassica napus]
MGETALMYVTKLVNRTLSQEEKIPQVSFDLVFEKEFELSHSLEVSTSLATKRPTSMNRWIPFLLRITLLLTQKRRRKWRSLQLHCQLLELLLRVLSRLTQSQRQKPEEVNSESDEDDEGSDEKVVSLCIS